MIAMRPNAARAGTEAGSQKPVVSKITSAPPAYTALTCAPKSSGLSSCRVW
ncbi:hypothetical protein D3C86_1529080 [compost metagenome]